ncbi:hypothetical protein FEM48_Zijuj05G0038800 [Ziziphus jujuba var. spinosa]|uniref:Uncharacterized protein n=1 Tax=Ziziphus jujuba var. spinosa TaxID=714518 RepID=A0A978VCN8_ZIZJJ|nr:hypothetical protein FEM48_Zijuj05G0038800 [Ziziphus jujuba var. spinosa]
MTAVQHRVQLYGCCHEGNNLILVYEYMANNSLEHVLFGTSMVSDAGQSAINANQYPMFQDSIRDDIPSPNHHKNVDNSAAMNAKAPKMAAGIVSLSCSLLLVVEGEGQKRIL